VRILFVTPAYVPAWEYGGVVTASHSLLQEMVSQGDDVTVYTTDAGLPVDDEGAQTGFHVIDGVKVHYFKCDCKRPILSRALTRKTRESIRDFDLMHLAAVWQPLSLGVRRAAVEAGCPYVLQTHGSLDVWPRRQKRWKKLLYYLFFERQNVRLAAGISYTSKMEMAGSSRFARRGQELCAIPNGVNFAQWARDAEGGRRWRADIGIPKDTYLYLSVGRLHFKKGLELVVRALAPLRGRDWHLAFVGDDGDGTKANLVRQASDLGLTDQISFHSTVSESRLSAIYSAGDLFVLPSYHENFGNVVLEALSCGCPVFISDQVAILEYLAGIKGVVVRKRDIGLWSEVLERALSRGDDLKTSMDDRDELERRLSVSDSAHKMMEFNSRVIARSRS
jgi:glycosyltransferase involved in cell wall biosynthesis